MTCKLEISQPFDLARILEMGQAFRWRRVGDEKNECQAWGDPPPEWLKGGGGWYSGVLGEHLVHLRQTGDGLEYRVGDLEYRVGDKDGERCDVDLDQRLRCYFRLDEDIDEIYAQLEQKDATLAQAIECYPGLRLLRQDPWECLVSYLCSQTNSIEGIKRNVGKIAKLSGEKVRLGDDKRFIFPSPQQIKQERTTLESLGLGLQRAPNIYRMAKQVAQDPTLLDLADRGVSEVVKELSRYRGIGPKIANCVALMSLEKMDAFPVDRWIRRGLVKCDLCDLSEMQAGLPEKVKSQRRLTDAQQRMVAEWARRRFGRYAGYAGQYLFHWVEPHKDAARHKRGMS